MKQKIMDKEKFDQNLKNKVERFEQEYSPVFNEHQVWKGIKKGNNRKGWVLIAAASTIMVLGLSFLFQQSKIDVEIVNLQKSGMGGSKSIQIPKAKASTSEIFINKYGGQKNETSNFKPKNPKVLNIVNQSIVTIAVADNIIQRVDSTQVGLVKIEEPVKIKNELPLIVKDVESEIKVTFKRGNPISTGLPPNSKLAFKRFKNRIFETQTSDTSAYASGVEVEPEKKFRIKF